MDRTELAKAYRNIGVAYLQAAEVLEGASIVNEQPPAKDATVGQLAQGLQPLPPVVAAVAPQPAPHTMADPLRCPAHGVPYRSGTRGLFCSQKGAEPAWTDRKGYCSVTPENAAQYVAIHTAR